MKQPETGAHQDEQDWAERMLVLSPDPTCVARLDGSVVQVNPAFSRLLGYGAEDLPALGPLFAVHSDDRSRTVNALLRLGAGEAITGLTLRMRSRDGRTLLLTWSAWSDPQAGRIYATGREVSEPPRPEAHDFPLLTLIESLPDLIFLKDAEGRWMLVNDQALHLFRLDRETYRGKTDAELALLSPFFREAFASCQTTDEEAWRARTLRHAEEVIPQPDGPDRIMETIKVPIFHPDGRRKALLVVGRDMTERKRTQAERERLLLKEQKARGELKAARRLDRLKNNFVNAVSHDLRVPLTSIMGYAEFLADGLGGVLSEAQGDYVRQIEQGARRLEALVNDLLDFARLDAGTFRLKAVETDLGLEIRQSAECLRPQLDAARLEVALDLAPEPLHAVMDPQRIEQVLINLLSNAIKFSPEGSRLTIRAWADAEYLRCEVSDAGEGIAPQDLPRLFKRFSQLEGGVKKGGTGLGLSISKAIIEAHGGAIGVHSTPGAGSTFWFTLPLAGPR